MKVTACPHLELLSIATLIEQLYMVPAEEAETWVQAALQVMQRPMVVYTELPDKREVPCVRYCEAVQAMTYAIDAIGLKIQNGWARVADDLIYCLRDAGALMFDITYVQPNQKQKRYERRVWLSQNDPTYYIRKRAADKKWRLSKKARHSDSN